MDFRIQSFKQAVFWSTAINAFSQGLALVFSMVMAAVFGASEGTDILYYGIGIFLLVSQMVQAVNVGVLIPETMRRRHQSGEADAMAFINRFFVLFGTGIAALTFWLLWNPAGALALISRFSEEVLARNSQIIFWLVLSFPLQMAAQLLLDVLVSYRFLSLPALLSCVNRLINVAFVLLFRHRFGVASVAIGMALGFALQVAVNAWLLGRVVGWRWGAWRTQIGRQTWRNIGWVELGTLATGLASYLPLFLFSGFSAGAMTVLNYARRLSSMPVDLLTAQVSSATAVKFNEQSARRDYAGMGLAFGRIQRVLILFLTPLAFALALAGEPLVSILFGRGAFDASAVKETARLFSVLMLVLPLTAVDNVVARLFVARQEVGFGTRCQIASSGLTAALIYGFVSWMGPMGFPVGICVSRGLYLLILTWVFPPRFSPATLWPVTKILAATMVASGVAAFAAWHGMKWVLPAEAGPWLTGAMATALFAVVYGGLLRYLPPDRQGRDEGLALARAAVRQMASKFRTLRHVKETAT
jgi:putative peptidoglycan lipid II flippase